MPFRMRAAPRFNYGSDPHVVSAVRDGVRFSSSQLSLYLGSTEPLAVDERDAVTEFTLEGGLPSSPWSRSAPRPSCECAGLRRR
jgi:hypothetical protein